MLPAAALFVAGTLAALPCEGALVLWRGASVSFAEALTSQTITFGALASQTYGAAPVIVSATASSGLPVAFASLTPAVCTVNGNTITLAAAGTCTIQASQAGDATYAAAASVNQTFTIAKATQAITFAALSARNYGDPPFTVSATASSGLAVTFTSSTTAICTAISSTVTMIAGGTCTIKASQPGNANYAAATAVSQSFSVAKLSQAIGFAGLASKIYGDPPFAISATASSGLAVAFSSLTTTVCTVSGTTVTIKTGGTCTIQAAQAGNAIYSAAPNVSQSFSVAKIDQSIAFAALANKNYGDPPFAVSATASSGLAVTFSSLTATACTLSGSTVTIKTGGPCTIQAAQAGNASYNAAPSMSRSFTIAKASQVITFNALANKTYGDPAFTMSATASSGLAVTLSSLTTTICTVSGSTVTMKSGGACTIQAAQAGNASYNAAPNVAQTFSIAPANQSITFAALVNKAYGAAPFTVSATASSGLAVTFASLTAPVCTVSAGTVTLVGVGTCTIQGTQPGSASYNPAPSVSQSFTVAQGVQTITFAALAGKAFGSAPFAVSATASSGLAVTFFSLTATICTVSGNTVTLVAVGTCSIDAAQAGNPNYAAAVDVAQSFTVSKGSQAITFAALVGQTYGAAPFGVSASASSGLPVTFVSTTAAVCTVAGNTVTMVAAGTCTIQAQQPGNRNYNAATSINQSFTVAKASQTISFGTLANQTYGAAPFSVTATASSGLPVAFASLTPGVCAVSAGTVTLTTGGTCTIQASQAGNANYLAATAVNQSFTIGKVSQTIAFGALADKSLGAAPFVVSATASSGLPVGFASLTGSVCAVSGNTVTLWTSGTCTIQASQAGNASYGAAPSVSQSFSVGLAGQTISFGAIPEQILGTIPSALTAAASSGLAVTFTSMTGSVCAVNGTLLTLLTVGTCTVQAAQTGNATYAPAPNVSQSFAVITAVQFDFQAMYAVGHYPWGVTSGDFNGDGKIDVAVTNMQDGTVSVFLGTGTGGLAVSATYSTGGAFPESIVAGDFNRDGKSDLAVANFLSKTVAILLGNGNGTFQAARIVNVGGYPTALSAADLNADGKVDLVATDGSSGSDLGQAVEVLIGNGDGTFQSGVRYSTGQSPNGVAVADFNGDGKLDVAVSNSGSNTLSVFLGNGDGTFQPAANYPAAYYPEEIAAADLNGDGKPDIVVLNALINSISLFLGKGDGTFASRTDLPVGEAPQGLAVADFNGDGHLDLAIANSFDDDIGVLLGVGDGTFHAPSLLVTGTYPAGVSAVDLNGDGKPDLVVANYESNTVSVLLNASNYGSAMSVTAAAGTPQSAQMNTAYATPLAAVVRDSSGNPLPGTLVTFTAPASGASGTFAGGGQSAQATTGASGVATAPTFTANAIAGAFSVIARAGTASGTFFLTNAPGNAPAFTSAPPPNGTVNLAYSFTVAASGTPAPTFSAIPNSLPPGLGLNGLSGLIAGTPTATGTYAGAVTAANGVLPNANQSFAITIAGATQTISFGSLPDRVLGAAPFAVNATASSGLPVTFVVPTPLVCTISGGNSVIFSAAGTCTIRATQGGNASYAAAPSVDRSFNVTAPDVLLTSPAPSSVYTAPANVRLTAQPGVAVGTVSKIEYFNGATLIDSATVAPYAALWTSVATGSYALTARATNSAGQTFVSPPVNVTIKPGQGATFLPRSQAYGLRGYPGGLALGDFNGDGKLDLAAPHVGQYCNSIFLGDGQGGFSIPLEACGTAQGGQVIARDFNGDGKLDLANVGAGLATLVQGNGDGSFTARSQIQIGGTDILWGVIGADFNGDGKLDLALTNASNDAVVVLLGNGDGTFQPARTFAVDHEPVGLVAADFNGDGKVDIAVTGTYYGTVSILLGNGDGTFQPMRTFGARGGPISIVAADFNGDGKQDLVTANFGSNDVSVLLGDGDGTFGPSFQFPSGGTPRELVAIDLNGDGKLDLAVANESDDTVSVLLGNGDGTFQAPSTFTVGSGPVHLVVGDLDGDGRPDLVVANGIDNTLSVLMNTSGRTTRSPAFTSAPLPGGNGASAYSYAVTASGVPAPTFVVTSGALPPGLTLQLGGRVTGYLPPPGRTYSGTITASNGIPPDATQAFSITPSWLSQTITFDPIVINIIPPSAVASASSGLPVNLTSLTPASCQLNGNVNGSSIIFQIPSGTCAIRASQGGGGLYLPAPDVDQSFAFDLNAPLIALTSPVDNANFGAPATITLTASLPSGLYTGLVNRIDFYADSTLVGTVTARPYTFTWANVGVGTYKVSAKVTTNFLGGTATSAPITVNVTTTSPPSVALTAPGNNATYPAPANIAVTASASSSVNGGSISKIELYGNGAFLATKTTAPYSFTWSNVAPGTYTLSAKATDNLGVTATSTPVTVIVTAALAPPTVVLTFPVNGAEYALGQAITFTAQASTPGRKIDHIEFYSDGSLLGSTPVTAGFASATTQLTWPGASLGAHVLSAKVVATDGTSATSAPVNVSVSDLATSLVEPTPGQVYLAPADVRLTAIPNETMGTIAKVDFYLGGVIVGSSTTPPYSFLVPGVAVGSYFAYAVTQDAAGLRVQSAAVQISVVAAAAVQVDAGIDGATIPDDSVSISGNVQAPLNSVVTISGLVAAFDRNGNFFLNKLRLQQLGANPVAVSVTTPDGHTSTSNLTVFSSGTAPFDVTLDKQEGIAPLEVTLTIANRGAVAFQRIEVDLNGGGSPEVTLTSLPDNTQDIDLDFPSPGIYSVGVKVFDTGNTVLYSAVRKVLVWDPRTFAMGPIGVYTGMLDRLRQGDVQGALTAITGTSNAKFAGIFNALTPDLASIVDQLGTIRHVMFDMNVMQILIERGGATPQTFIINLLRGEDGIWRIEDM